jgi:hypothetical protein
MNASLVNRPLLRLVAHRLTRINHQWSNLSIVARTINATKSIFSINKTKVLHTNAPF